LSSINCCMTVLGFWPGGRDLLPHIKAIEMFSKYVQVSILSTFYVRLLRQYSYTKKLQSQNLTRKMLRKTLLFEKFEVKCWWNWPQSCTTSSSNLWVKPCLNIPFSAMCLRRAYLCNGGFRMRFPHAFTALRCNFLLLTLMEQNQGKF